MAGTTANGGYSPSSVSFDGIACKDATHLRTCANTFESLVDCGTVGQGFTCQTDGTASFCGLATECSPGALGPPTCDGNSLVVCNAGKITKVDCTTLGFTGCNAQVGACSPGPF